MKLEEFDKLTPFEREMVRVFERMARALESLADENKRDP